MEYSTVFVGMDVHKDTFSVCCYTYEDGKCRFKRTFSSDYKNVLQYIASMHKQYGEKANFVTAYEAGCLGYSLYNQLTAHNVECIIMAPTTMAKTANAGKHKTDRLDSEMIAKCLADRNYHAVHVPTEEDDQVKEYIRMRDDHKLALKKIKQQILAFCLRRGLHYSVFALFAHNFSIGGVPCTRYRMTGIPVLSRPEPSVSCGSERSVS